MDKRSGERRRVERRSVKVQGEKSERRLKERRILERRSIADKVRSIKDYEPRYYGAIEGNGKVGVGFPD